MTAMENGWRLDKSIPLVWLLGVFVATILQTFAIGVWVENHDQRLDNLERLAPIVAQKLDKLNEQREKTGLSINTIETKVDSLLTLARRSADRDQKQDNDKVKDDGR
jgi:hypothetical protein